MKEKNITRTQTALQVEASQQTLPDESDLIIHELNQKLAVLRQQLLNYEHKRSRKAAADPEHQQTTQRLRERIARQEEQVQRLREEKAAAQFQAEMLPRTVDTLREPVTQVHEQLDLLLQKIEDPEVRRALQQCQQLATQMLVDAEAQCASAEEINKHYEPQKRAVELLRFFRNVARNYTQKEECPLRLFASPRLPQQMLVDPAGLRRALGALMQEAHRRNPDKQLQLLLQPKEGQASSELQITIKGGSPWQIPPVESWGRYLEHAMTDDHSNDEEKAELLVGRKIVQAHQGKISLRREGGDVVGLEVNLPLAAPSALNGQAYPASAQSNRDASTTATNP